MKPKIDATHYYDLNPGLDHRPGDIWSDLPTFGVLRKTTVAGLVITPACDLTNRKVPTITYLPILPIPEYLISPGHLASLWSKILGQLQSAQLAHLVTEDHTSPIPADPTFGVLVDAVTAALSAPRLSAKERSALERAAAGLRICTDYAAGVTRPATTTDFTLLCGSSADKELSDLVKNSHKADLHFLPRDQQPIEWSGVPWHSVALFRFPITVPFEILDEANFVSEEAWEARVKQMEPYFPCAASFRAKRPMKRISMKTPFIADLLTRYLAVYGRLGSPDFTPETIENFVATIRTDP